MRGICEDITGKRFGKLTVVKRNGKNKNNHSIWLCKCDCGKYHNVIGSYLKNGTIKSCGCSSKEDYTGKRFGMLVALKRTENDNTNHTRWICKCDCGNIINVRQDSLKNIKNCGCIKKKRNIYKIEKLRTMRKHIITRCYKENCKEYKNYGNRGIKVCDEWLDKENGLNNFCKWALENGFNENAKFQECTIDRIDVNGNYEPNNCRFVSNYIQARNKTNNVYIEYKGRTKIMADWAKEFNLTPSCFRGRYLRGWSMEKIESTPMRIKKRGVNNEK